MNFTQTNHTPSRHSHHYAMAAPYWLTIPQNKIKLRLLPVRQSTNEPCIQTSSYLTALVIMHFCQNKLASHQHRLLRIHNKPQLWHNFKLFFFFFFCFLENSATYIMLAMSFLLSTSCYIWAIYYLHHVR